MTIRDLGYRPYEGIRLPPSHNTWVMLRQGLMRAWGSWMVKVAVFLCLVPSLLIGTVVAARRLFFNEMGADADAVPEDAIFFGVQTMRIVFATQTWLFVSLVTAGAGSTAVAEDFSFKAFQFYFAKPVTPLQYFVGRVLAVAIFVFGVTFIPALLVNVVLAGTAPPTLRLTDFGLIVPSLVHSLLLAIVMSTLSVAISSLSASRALTLSAWLFLFLVPHVVAAVIDGLASMNEGDGWPWLYLASFTGLLGIIADELFKAQGDEPLLRWYFAAPVLVLYVSGAASLIFYRLRRAEVFG
jgi:ABC-type transport system involved in multi-copper enzyme maturation permease subunit